MSLLSNSSNSKSSPVTAICPSILQFQPTSFITSLGADCAQIGHAPAKPLTIHTCAYLQAVTTYCTVLFAVSNCATVIDARIPCAVTCLPRGQNFVGIFYSFVCRFGILNLGSPNKLAENNKAQENGDKLH